MPFGRLLTIVCFCSFALPAFSSVTVSSPSNGSTSSSPVHFVATGSSPACSKGVAAMGIYTSPNVLAYQVNGPNLDTNLTMSPGTYDVTVKQWDNCGWATGQSLTVAVSGTVPQVTYVFSDLQSKNGWTG